MSYLFGNCLLAVPFLFTTNMNKIIFRFLLTLFLQSDKVMAGSQIERRLQA